jgi:DNA-binding NarL/FixJ family response regulator
MVIPGGPVHATSDPIRVLVCAAHAHLQWGLRKLVDGEWPRLQLVAMVSSLNDAESFLQSHPTEVALLDFPDTSKAVFSDVERLCREFCTSFVMLDGDEDVRNRLARAGVKAVLPLDAPADEILTAVYLAVAAPHEH